MKTKLFAFIWIGIFLLISCAPANLSTPTPNIVFIKTSAAQTVVANFTLTAASAAFTSTTLHRLAHLHPLPRPPSFQQPRLHPPSCPHK